MNYRKFITTEFLSLAIGLLGVSELIAGSVIYSGLLVIMGLFFTGLAVLNLPHEHDDQQIESE